MFAASWVCRSCSQSLARSSAQFLRRASTTASNNAALPPALLQRARKFAAEHTQLSDSLSSNFDAQAAKRAGELFDAAAALKEWEAAKTALAELQGLLESDDAELRDLAKDDLEATSSLLDDAARKLSMSLTPKHPFAHMPCLIEFRPGPGGLESRFFSDSLFRMYQQYCARRGYRARVVKYEISDNAGDASGSTGEKALQEAVLEVQDAGSYDAFRGEAGMHRVQRVPATEKSGRTHTSATAVWVLPSFPEGGGLGEDGGPDNATTDPESDFYIDPSDVRSETMRARGAGGQHVNKTESAIRLTHIPTSTTVSMQDSRSQQRNREAAWRLLRSRIAQKRREAREELARQLRSSVLAKSQVTRGDKIRTYNYQQDRCTDHRTGVDVHNLPDVLEGGETLDRIMDGVREWLAEVDIQAAIAEEEAETAAASAQASEGKAKGQKK